MLRSGKHGDIIHINELSENRIVLHLVCCLILFKIVHELTQCIDDANEIIKEDVSEASSNEKSDAMENGLWEEPEYMVGNEEK